MRKVGILIERQRAFGRQLCSGVVQYAQTRDDWSLAMLDLDDLARPSHLASFDGFIVRILNDEIARKFANTGRPVVDVFEGGHAQPFVKVIQDAEEVSRLAAEHFLERNYRSLVFFSIDWGNVHERLWKENYLILISVKQLCRPVRDTISEAHNTF